MLSINTNLSSLIAQSSLKSSTSILNQAVERMTTGYKINHAKDNAANYSISTNMTTKINSYMVAEDNCAMGLDMITTAGESLGQIGNKLTRLRDLATQAGNGTYGATSLNAINAEANALVDEINRLYQTAEYNGIKLFQGLAPDSSATPAVAAYGARAASTNTTYTDEEVAAMTELTTDVDTITEGGEYAIYDADQLAHLASLVNGGKLSSISEVTFVLADDIDLKKWCDTNGNWIPIGIDDSYYSSFHGTFDGNGHVISNLKIDSTEDYQGLFGYVNANSDDGWDNATIKNVGLEDVNVKGGENVGGLVGYAYEGYYSTFELANNYVTGAVTGTSCVGGLVGDVTNQGSDFDFKNNYATGFVSATDGGYKIGGLIGRLDDRADMVISNNFSTVDVNASNCDEVGGFVGSDRGLGEPEYGLNYATGTVVSSGASVGGFVGDSCSSPIYTNCFSVQADDYATQMTAEEIAATYTPETMGFTADKGWTIVNGQPLLSWQKEAQPTPVLKGSNYITLQVGIGNGESSRIGLELGFSLVGVDDLRMIGLDTTTDYLAQLDNMLSTVNAKEVEYGAAQNRLESALDEISIQYENLVSSRSTIRDADIADESSTYIQQQILQQAASTLLATANQSPSIALQLI